MFEIKIRYNQPISVGLVFLFLFAAFGPITVPAFSQAPDHPPSSRDLKYGWSEDFAVTGTKGTMDRTILLNGKVQLDADPLHFTKYPGNPVLSVTPGKFDSVLMRGNSVIFDEGIFKMWYSGNDGTKQSLGYATSTDGINWTKQNNGDPVLTPGPGSFENQDIYQVWVLKDSVTYKMWFTCHGSNIAHICYATSNDGIHWDRYSGNPVFVPDGSGFDSTHVAVSTVLKENGVYKMWYTGNDGSTPDNAIGYATSTDGLSWSRRNDAVLKVGPSGAFDSVGVCNPVVISTNGLYYAYYSGYDGSTYTLGLASSTDGISWTRLNGGHKVLDHGTPAAWDGTELLEHSVIEQPGKIFLWYGGGLNYANFRIGLASADYYHEGFLVSEPITPPPGQTWKYANFIGDAPAGTNLSFTILDGDTQAPISGFEDWTYKNIPLSGLNYKQIGSIILKAKFTSDGTATPWLGGWNVSWRSFEEPIVNITSPQDEDLLDAAPFNMTGTVRFLECGTLGSLEWRVDNGNWTDIVPMSLDWSVIIPLLSSGKHILDVQARSTGGISGTDSILVVIKYPQKMLCVITYPRDYQEVHGITPIRGYAFDPGGSVTKGTLNIGPKVLGFDIQLDRWGVKFNMSVLPNALTPLTASISDGQGHSASDTVKVWLESPPTVKILYPLNGTRIMEKDFWIKLNLNYTGQHDIALRIYVNGKMQWQTSCVPGNLTYNLTSPDKPGNFTILAIAYDVWGEPNQDIKVPVRYYPPIIIHYKTWLIPVPWWVFAMICALAAIVIIYDHLTRPKHN